jgi:hypothetical protein
LSGHPTRIRDIFSELQEIEWNTEFRHWVGAKNEALVEMLQELGVEHARIKGERLRDPRFERYYQKHGISFLDVIERSYLGKLNSGSISRADFYRTMRSYVTSHSSGSQGRQRRLEADHIVSHVLAQLVRNYRVNKGTASQSLRDYSNQVNVRPRVHGEDETPLERAVKRRLQSDKGERP